MKNKSKIVQNVLILLMAVVFTVTALGTAQAGTYQIPAKGNKKIKIGVLDLISAIEVAALANGYYKKYAKERGWDLQIFDLGGDWTKAPAVMENMITAGYDAIIINWTDFRIIEKQILKARERGIPVQGIACGNIVPGVVAHGAAPDAAMGAMSAMYLGAKLLPGDKVLAYHDPRAQNSVFRFNVAKATLENSKIKIAQEMHATAVGGDFAQKGYEEIKNALLADHNKEIKGIWTHWEGYGIPAAKAAQDMNRPDIIVVTADDSPNTYKMLRELPNLHATAGNLWACYEWTNLMFRTLDKIFAGKPVRDMDITFTLPNLITKDNLPPPGYYFSHFGYKNRKPDFKVVQ